MTRYYFELEDPKKDDRVKLIPSFKISTDEDLLIYLNERFLLSINVGTGSIGVSFNASALSSPYCFDIEKFMR